MICRIGLFVAAAAFSAPQATVASTDADQLLFFSKAVHVPLEETPLVFGVRDAIHLELELRTLSIEDRDRFPALVIDDYRFDVPAYYVDRRVPNVRFEVLALAGGVFTAAPYRVSTQGDRGLDVEYHMADVQLQLGRSRPMYWLIDHLGYFGGLVEHHWRGRYRIRAFYREFATSAIFVTVK